MPASVRWHSLCASPSELRCAVTLTNGQCFGWRKHPSRLEWSGVLAQLVLSLRQTDDDTLFAVHHPAEYSEAEVSAALRDWLHLDRARLVDMYADWSGACDRFAFVASRLPGMRLLRQEPVECLVGFICSSCNNIARITQMMGALRRQYGQHLCDVRHGQQEGEQQVQTEAGSEQTANVESYYAFPSLSQLALIPSSELRALGFGYRAEYVTESACEVARRGGLDWLTTWRSPDVSTEAVLAALQELPGVGPKVAACVALFSLDRLDLIPVDTHVHQIALRDYGVQLSAEVRRSKSVTKSVHASIAALFRDKFGPLAGWAHSVLFTAELPAFKHMLGNTALQVSTSSSNIARERKRGRGVKLEADALAEVEADQAEQRVGGVKAEDSEEQNSAVKAEVLVKVETVEAAPVVKRARIPRKTVVVRRSERVVLAASVR